MLQLPVCLSGPHCNRDLHQHRCNWPVRTSGHLQHGCTHVHISCQRWLPECYSCQWVSCIWRSGACCTASDRAPLSRMPWAWNTSTTARGMSHGYTHKLWKVSFTWVLAILLTYTLHQQSYIHIAPAIKQRHKFFWCFEGGTGEVHIQPEMFAGQQASWRFIYVCLSQMTSRAPLLFWTCFCFRNSMSSKYANPGEKYINFVMLSCNTKFSWKCFLLLTHICYERFCSLFATNSLEHGMGSCTSFSRCITWLFIVVFATHVYGQKVESVYWLMNLCF